MNYPVYLLHSGHDHCDVPDPGASTDTDQTGDKKSFYPVFFILCTLCYTVCNDISCYCIRYCFPCFRSWSACIRSIRILAYKGKSLFQVSIVACAVVFILEFFV